MQQASSPRDLSLSSCWIESAHLTLVSVGFNISVALFTPIHLLLDLNAFLPQPDNTFVRAKDQFISESVSYRKPNR